MLYQFLLHSKMTQSYIYIHSFLILFFRSSRHGAAKMNPTRNNEAAGSASLSGLKIRQCRELWCRSQTRLRYGVAVVQAGSNSSDQTLAWEPPYAVEDIKKKIIFHLGLSQEIGCSFLCYTVGPHCLSILNVIVSIYQPQNEQTKDFEIKRLSQIIWVSSKYNHKYIYNTEVEGIRHRHTEEGSKKIAQREI